MFIYVQRTSGEHFQVKLVAESIYMYKLMRIMVRNSGVRISDA